MKSVKRIFLQRPLLFVYLFVIFILTVGVIEDSGLKHLDLLLIYLFSFIISYYLFQRFLFRESNANWFQWISKRIDRYDSNLISIIVFTIIIGFIVFHFIYLSEFPLIESYLSNDSLWIADYRNNLTGNSLPIINYLSSFFLTAIIPFFLLYFNRIHSRWIFIGFVILTSFYALNMLQKSFIVTIFLPLLTYKLLKKEFWSSALILLFIVFSLFVIVYISNPSLRGNDNADPIEMAKRNSSQGEVKDSPQGPVVSILIGLTSRILIIPGNIVSKWFSHIPADKPYLNGCGYRFLAPSLGCEYRNYSRELYAIFYPEYIERGFTGSANGASFVYEYANFGKTGLVLSGILIAFILIIVAKVYSNDHFYKIAFNIFPIFMLSSSALSTLLFSGGWGLTIILFILFRNKLITHT